jgi:hypothetical protein
MPFTLSANERQKKAWEIIENRNYEIANDITEDDKKDIEKRVKEIQSAMGVGPPTMIGGRKRKSKRKLKRRSIKR